MRRKDVLDGHLVYFHFFNSSTVIIYKPDIVSNKVPEFITTGKSQCMDPEAIKLKPMCVFIISLMCWLSIVLLNGLP
jgi:hypothetical protein